jgi:hypothetical protein
LSRIYVLLGAVVAAVIVAATAGASQHFGGPPYCVGKPGLAPVRAITIFGQHVTVPRAGVQRDVAKGQKCRSDEISRHGVLDVEHVVRTVGHPGATGPQGPAGQTGAQGAQGPAGATGAAGAKGDKGETGAAGQTGAQGPAGAPGERGPAGESGAKGDTGATGAPGPKGDTGATGAAGPPGAKGDTGPAGPTGPQGPAGTDGIGNGTIQACVSNGGTLQLDVNGQPCDNQGHQPITLVVVN